MPLPDADKKSPRVYTNLQNLDLDTVTFANIQSTGNPIAVEEMNEDEMRRLVLVNLARLVTAGEWNGLLSAGGGAFNLELLPPDFDGSTEEYQIVSATPPGTNDVQGQQQAQGGWMLYSFVAAKSGDLASMGVYVSSTGGCSAGTIDVGIYSDNDGVPSSLLGYGQFDPTSTGVKTDTSLSATITLTRGTQYWISWFKNGTNANPSLYSAEYDNGGGTGIGANVFSQGSPTIADASTVTPTSFPSSITASNLNSAGGYPKLMVGIKWS
jgi:hypothetical protein